MNVSDIPQPKGWLDATGKVLSQVAQHLLADLRFAALWLWASGTTGQRPTNPQLGQLFYDTTLGALVYCSNPGTPASGTPATWALVDAPVVNNPVSTTITVSGAYSYTVPAGTNLILCESQAPGGGCPAAGTGSATSGAGAGECIRFVLPVAPGDAITGTLGAAAAGVAGGNNTVVHLGETITAIGGPAGILNGAGGAGGGRKGPTGGATGTPGSPGTDAVIEGLDSLSGASGGGCGTVSANAAGGNGGAAEQWSGGTAGAGSGGTNKPGGGGGGASKNGPGGNGTAGSAGTAVTPTTPTGFGGGAGGAGAGVTAGGGAVAGAPGFISFTPL